MTTHTPPSGRRPATLWNALLVVLGIVVIAWAGYRFGQWLAG